MSTEEKCYKCGETYTKTPICCNCGTIPIVSDDIQRLRETNATLLEACKNAQNVLAGLATGDLNTITPNSRCLRLLRLAVESAE